MPSTIILLTILAPATAAEPDDFFEREVRPLLVQHCQECHGPDKTKGGLRLTSRAELLKGGETGPVVVAGKPDESALVQAIRYMGDGPRMPPKGKLDAKSVEVLTRWVKAGAPWPETNTVVQSTGSPFRITDEQRRYWAFQPVKTMAAPAVRDAAWARSDLDRFILAGLEAKGLQPAASTDKRTLLRRATFDLTGLPPTPEEVDAFLKDDSPDAFAKVVDRLLASPTYGERWGRHWLDLVRYTDSFDSRGIGGEGDSADAWRYRDWVVNAFNRDLPYDRFVREQIAGDVLGDGPDGIVATGMLALGNWGGGDADKEKLLTDIADDQVDVVSRTFLGLTVACARCHDHKFDPISTADYYGLAGIFFSTHILPNVGPKTGGPPMLRIPLETAEQKALRARHVAEVADLEKRIRERSDAARADVAARLRERTSDYLMAALDYRTARNRDVATFATERKLEPFALRNWLAALGWTDDRLLSQPIRDVLGNAGVHGWRGPADCPSLLVNTTADERTLLTFKLPPKSIALHPGPSAGVALAWRSPVAATVRIRGRVADADRTCGDGIAWTLAVRREGTRSELAKGAIGNGGSEPVAPTQPLAVEPGDRLELSILPKGEYTCDTTVVELEIAAGDLVWNATRDLTADPFAGNPHKGVWHVLDLAGAAATKPIAGLEPWLKAVASGADRADLQRLAETFAKLDRPKDGDPFRPEVGDLPTESRTALDGLRSELERLKKQAPPAPPLANGAQEGGVPNSPHAGTHDVNIHIRGRYDRLGERVPRRFPEVLAGAKQAPIGSGSGRREFADWLTKPDHPLTARVMVNRIWQFHFGEGLVRTPSNFGRLGERPTHPELLDWLAAKFVQTGWSIKAMHRLVMLSATYRQSCEPSVEALKVDPDNRLWGRTNRRRLEAEALRDSMLAVAGRLDRTMGGPSLRDFNAPRRTLYLTTIRSDRSGFGPLFDVADPTAPVDRRTVSTVAPQALFQMNHPFAVEQAKAFARRILAEADPTKRLERAYRIALGRGPTASESVIAKEFVGSGSEADWVAFAQILLCSNEFLYVD